MTTMNETAPIDPVLAAWPAVPLPAGTDYGTWLKAASLSQIPVDELLQENSRVRAAHYENALRSIAEQEALTAAIVPGDPARWDVHVRAEATLTDALRQLQNNEVLDALALIVRAASQVVEVHVMDEASKNKEEGK